MSERLPLRRLLVAIVVAGALLRFVTLGVQSLAEDESVTALLMHQSFGGMLGHLPQSETTPPLYYVLEWLSTRPLGLGELGARFLSALAGTLTIPLAAQAARLMAGRWAAIAAAALVASNPFLVWYSQEARAYALLVMLTAAGLVCFVHVVRDDRGRWLAAWSAVSVLALLTHYFALPVIAAEAAWILMRRRPAAWAALGAPAVAGLALLPLLYAQTHPSGRSFHQKFQVPAESLPVRLLRLPREWALGFAAPAGKVLALLALAGLAWAVVAAAGAPEPARRRVVLVIAIGAAGTLLPVLGALGGKSTDFVASRNLVAALVPLLIAAAAAQGRARAALVVPLAVGLFAVIAVAANGRYQRVDYRDAVAATGTPGGRRVIAMTRRLVSPLVLYAREHGAALPLDRAYAVDEIDVLGLPAEGRLTPVTLQGMAPPAPGFRLVSARRTKQWQLARFRAGREVQVSPAALRASPLLSGGSAVVQAPPAPVPSG